MFFLFSLLLLLSLLPYATYDLTYDFDITTPDKTLDILTGRHGISTDSAYDQLPVVVVSTRTPVPFLCSLVGVVGVEHEVSLVGVVVDELGVSLVGVVVGGLLLLSANVGVGVDEREVSIVGVDVDASSGVVLGDVVVHPMRFIMSVCILLASLRRSLQSQLSSSSESESESLRSSIVPRVHLY